MGILLLAAWLRWSQPSVVEFKYDEAHIFHLSRNVAAGVSLPLLTGGTSLGIERPPLDVYLLALPAAAAGGHPEAAVWLLGALGVVAVALTYCLGRALGGPAVGILAALFMATNPWLVHYDRKLWAHIQVALSVALLLLAWEVVVRQRARAAFLFFVLAALQLLTHVLAVVQALSWVGAVLIAPRRWRTKATAYGLVAGILLMAPYLAALAAFSRSTETSGDGLASEFGLRLGLGWGQLAALIGGSGIASLAGAFTSSSPWWQAASSLGWLVLALTIAGLVQVMLWARRGPHAPGARLLLAWGAGPLLALSLAAPVFPQYWTVLAPLPALLFAAGARAMVHGIESLLARRKPATAGRRIAWVWVGMVTLAAIIALVWIGSYQRLLTVIAQGGGADAFGVPLLRWQAAAATAKDWAQRSGTDQVLAAVQGVDPRFEDEPAVMTALMRAPVAARFVAPSSPFALVDTRYELEPAVQALTAGGRYWPYDEYPSAPGALALDETQPTLLLWTIDRPDWQETLSTLGEVVWQGQLASDRVPATLYRLPARATLWQHLAATADRMAGGAPAGQARIIANLADSPLLTSMAPATPAQLIPATANDPASAQAAALSLTEAGISRVVLVDQPSGWWDNGQIARSALSNQFAPIADTKVAVWPITIFERPPAEMPSVDWAFAVSSEAGASPDLRLAKAAITGSENDPGGVVGVHLAWDAALTQPDNLKITLQLLDESGNLAAQVDQPFALSTADAVTSHGLVLPQSLAGGRYRLILALYDGQSGQRLLIQPDQIDYVELGSVYID